MYAVIKTGGKQYKVASGDVLKIEKIAGEEGNEVVFNEVLAIGETVGKPLVKGASVKAKVIKQAKDEKIIVFKKKRRHNYRRKNGHRQLITLVKITDIVSAKAAAPKASTEDKGE
ncbi:MAG: 50S ribosomal protein L21 [Lactobacillus sp.]|jgi:large subunit ribosomal protein L21|nr:50S ribosomal protein L21 [Lactobacillus sp.]